MSNVIELKPTSITIDNVFKRFGNNEVLKGINIKIKPGEFFTLLGSSGCGKTTLLRMIAGFEDITSGKILFDDKNISSKNPWERNVGFVFQNYALWPHMNTYDNIAYGLRMRKYSKELIDERVKWGLSVAGLEGLEKRYPGQMSGGQQQRIAIVRALVIQPQVLLLDEPLSNLDVKLRIRMRKDIRDLQQSVGITAVYVTHDQEEALEISDNIAVFESGVIKQIGSPRQIYKNPENRFVAGFVGVSSFIEGKIVNGDFYTKNNTHIILKDKIQMENCNITLCFRPEDAEISPIKSEDATCAIKKSISYKGSNITYVLEVDDGILCTVNSDKEFDDESLLWLKINKFSFFKEG